MQVTPEQLEIPKIVFVDVHNQLCLNNEHLQATQHRIVALQQIQYRNAAVLAISTENSEFKNFIIIYDPVQHTTLQMYETERKVGVMRQFGNMLLTASDDYISCFRLESRLVEQFWTTTGEDVLDLFQISKTRFVAVCADMYLRVFENDVLASETRAFARQKIVKIQQFFNFVGILLQNNKIKVYYITQDSVKCVLNDDLNNHCQNQAVEGFGFLFKPFSKPMGAYVEDQQLPHYTDLIERQIQVDHAIPFVAVLFQDAGYQLFMIDLAVDKAKNQLIPVLQSVFIFEQQDSKFLLESNLCTSNEEILQVFYNQYKNPDQLPPIHTEVKNQVKMFLGFVNQEEFQLFQCNINFDFNFFVNWAAGRVDCNGQAVQKKKKATKDAAIEDPAVAAGRKKKRGIDDDEQKEKKVIRKKLRQKREEIELPPELLELIQLQQECFELQMSQVQTESASAGKEEILALENAVLKLEPDNQFRLDSELEIRTLFCQIGGQPIFGSAFEAKQIAFPQLLTHNSELIAQQLELKSQLNLQDYSKLSEPNKIRFHFQECKRSGGQFGGLPENLAQAVYPASAGVVKNGQLLQVPFNLKLGVIPQLRLSKLDAQIKETTFYSNVVFDNVSPVELQIAVQLFPMDKGLNMRDLMARLLQIPELTLECRSNVSPLRQKMAQPVELEFAEGLFLTYSQQTQQLIIASNDTMLLQGVAKAFARASRSQPASADVSPPVKSAVRDIKEQIGSLKQRSAKLHMELVELSQAQQFNLTGILNEAAQQFTFNPANYELTQVGQMSLLIQLHVVQKQLAIALTNLKGLAEGVREIMGKDYVIE